MLFQNSFMMKAQFRRLSFFNLYNPKNVMKKLSLVVLCALALSCDKNETDPLTISLNLSSWKIIEAEVLEDGVVSQTLTPDVDMKNVQLSFVKDGKIYFGSGSCGQWRTKGDKLQFKIYEQQVVPGLCQDANATKIYVNDSETKLTDPNNLEIQGLGGALSYFQDNSEWNALVKGVAQGEFTIRVHYERVEYSVSPTTECCAKL